MTIKLITICFLGCVFFIALLGCSDNSDVQIKKNLMIILDDDLKTVVNDTPKKSVIDSTYFTIVTYEEFDQGKYTKKAVVDFYFLKKVNVKIVRKYRYHSTMKKWDRYLNEYRFYEISE